MGKHQRIDFKNNAENDELLTLQQTEDTAITVEVPQEILQENSKNLAEILQYADKDKAEIEQKYSTPTLSLEQIAERERQENLQTIHKLYDEGMLLFQMAEKEEAIKKLEQAVEIDADYYLAWFGLLQVHTDSFQNLDTLEQLDEIYDNAFSDMPQQERERYHAQYALQLQAQIDRFTETYQAIETEDIQMRQDYQPTYNKKVQTTKPIFWTMLGIMLFFAVGMSATWPFLHVVAGTWIAYLSIAVTALTGIFLLLFLIFAWRLGYLYGKKRFCARLGNSVYGEDMRKLAKEREKYMILLEDFSRKAE